MKSPLLLACSLLLLASFLTEATAEQPVPTAAPRREAPSPRLPEGARVLRDIEYIPSGHERQKLDLYLPAGDDKPLPLIIWVHGGAWQAGSKDRPPALRFLQRGYAVASVNYRLSQHAIFPAQIEDCQAAVRWLRANAAKYNLDPNRFGAWGSSAGGHLVALLGTAGDATNFVQGPHAEVSARVQAVVDFFGPTDLTLMTKQSGPESTMNHDAADSPESRLVGGAIQENKDKAALANPILFVTKNDPPMLLVHGDKDPLVPHGQSEILLAALQKAGIEATLYTVKGGGHGSGFGPEVPRMVEEFFYRHLKTTRPPIRSGRVPPRPHSIEWFLARSGISPNQIYGQTRGSQHFPSPVKRLSFCSTTFLCWHSWRPPDNPAHSIEVPI